MRLQHLGSIKREKRIKAIIMCSATQHVQMQVSAGYLLARHVPDTTDLLRRLPPRSPDFLGIHSVPGLNNIKSYHIDVTKQTGSIPFLA